MTNWKLLITLLALVMVYPTVSFAQDAAEGDELSTEGLMAAPVTDEEVPSEEAEVIDMPETEEMGVATYWGDEALEETVHGFFIVTRFGAQMFFLDGATKDSDPGFMTGLGFGYDILDKYLSLEVDALFSFHGGKSVAEYEPPTTSGTVKGMQRDFSMLRVPLAITGRYFPTKRFEIHGAVTGGLAYSPQAVEVTYDVNPNTGVVTPTVADGPVLDYYAGARIGVEYYTGLRHFSIGLDLEADYIIQHESLGFSVAPYVKYTF